MIKIRITLLMLGLILSSPILASTPKCQLEPNGQKPRYVIFFVHGLAGNNNAFGDAGPALVKHMPQINPCYEYQYANIGYNTGGDSEYNNAYKFYIEIGSQIDAHFQNLPGWLSPLDRLALISHSQGGIVSTLWYYRSSVNKKFGWSKYADQVDALITVGTPFWGAKIAHFGFNTWKTIPGVKYLMNKFNLGSTELNALSHGSDITERFHTTTIALDQKDELKSKFKFRPLSIIGILGSTGDPKFNIWRTSRPKSMYPNEYFKWWYENWFGNTVNWTQHWILSAAIKKGFGGQRYESDLAVAAPSARPNFYYAQDLTSDYEPNGEIGFEKFRLLRLTETSDEIPLVVLEAMHASPDSKNMYDMVAIPPKCIRIEDCDHSTYPVLIKHLLNCSDPNSTCNQDLYKQTMLTLNTNAARRFPHLKQGDLIEKLRGYTLELSLHLPEDFDYSGLKRLKENEILNIVKVRRKNIEDTIQGLGEDDSLAELKNPRNRPAQENNKDYEIYFGRDIEKWSALSVHSSSDSAELSEKENLTQSHNQLRIHITGIIVPEIRPTMSLAEVDAIQARFKSYLKTGVPLHFIVEVPGLKPRQVRALVRPSYATVVDVALAE